MKSKGILIATLLVACASSGAFAQNKNVRKAQNSFEDKDYKEAKSYINEAAANSKTSDKAKTWYVRGDVYSKLSQKDSTSELSEAYRDTAYMSYRKTLELDQKYPKMLLTSYRPLWSLYTSYFYYGLNGFNTKNYEAAFQAFKKVKEVNDYMYGMDMGMGNKMDTTAILNIGNAAFNGERKDTAIKYYQKLADINYAQGSFIYKVLLQYYRNKSEDKFFAVLDKAKKLFPDNKDLTKVEINYYNSKGETDKLIKKLKDLLKEEPDNYNAALNLAVSYDNQANPKSDSDTAVAYPENHDELFNEAEKYYKKAIEIKPDGYEANFNLGLMYYNTAAHYGDKLGDLTEKDRKAGKQDTIQKNQDKYLKIAFPYLDKTYNLLDAKSTLDPNEMVTYKNVIRGLQGIYARQDKMDKYNELKKKLEEASSKAE